MTGPPQAARGFPAISVEVVVDNGFADIVAERFDAGSRLGDNIDHDMFAVPIGPHERMIVVGTRDYLAEHPPWTNSAELTANRCINRHMPTVGGLMPLPFARYGRGDRALSVSWHPIDQS